MIDGDGEPGGATPSVVGDAVPAIDAAPRTAMDADLRPPIDSAAPHLSIARAFGALGVFLLGMLAGAPFVMLSDRLPTGVWLFLVSVPGEIAGLVAALYVARWPIARLREQCAIPRGSTPVLIVMAFGCLLVTAAGLWLGRRLMPFEGPDDLMFEVASIRNPIELGLVAFAIVVLGPIAEELIVRGILLRGFAVNWGVPAGVAVSAFLFAVLHMNPVQGMLGIVTGTVFALTVLRTGLLGPGILMHVVINGNAIAAVIASGGPGMDDVPESPPLVVAILVGVIGLTLVRWGLRKLPRDPVRLARLWGLPAPPR